MYRGVFAVLALVLSMPRGVLGPGSDHDERLYPAL
jgi:hypothetical protein